MAATPPSEHPSAGDPYLGDNRVSRLMAAVHSASAASSSTVKAPASRINRGHGPQARRALRIRYRPPRSRSNASGDQEPKVGNVPQLKGNVGSQNYALSPTWTSARSGQWSSTANRHGVVFSSVGPSPDASSRSVGSSYVAAAADTWPGDGIAPSCCISPMMSISARCSTTLPPTNR
jgi:hypothetical protein